MKAASTIRIANVYYMLAYAFEALRRGPYVKINPDEFVNAEDMFGWILGLGISRLIKQGLHREYEDVVEDAPVLRGKINFGGTMKHWLLRRPLLRVEHDEFSENNLFNQILKATASVLLKSGRLKLSKNLIKNLLPCFVSVSDVPPCDIRWNRLRYQRNKRLRV